MHCHLCNYLPRYFLCRNNKRRPHHLIEDMNQCPRLISESPINPDDPDFYINIWLSELSALSNYVKINYLGSEGLCFPLSRSNVRRTVPDGPRLT